MNECNFHIFAWKKVYFKFLINYSKIVNPKFYEYIKFHCGNECNSLSFIIHSLSEQIEFRPMTK